jgi:predicted AAA+ superfamily ATPase
MCAARTGQLLDFTSIGNDCGISHNTVKSWISILEASFVIFLLKPFYKNYNKRLIKNSKIYFYDTGLLCHLLNIESAEQLTTHYLRGGIFESFILSELIKNKFHNNQNANFYFWRDKTGHEIDCIIEKGQSLTPIEIKSAKTINIKFFDGLKYFNDLSKNPLENSYVIYAGKENQTRSCGKILSWNKFSEINF